MGDVVELNNVTTLPVPSERILRRAIEAGVTNVVVIGYDPDGKLWFASSDADGGDVLWLLEKTKQKLLAIGEE